MTTTGEITDVSSTCNNSYCPYFKKKVKTKLIISALHEVCLLSLDQPLHNML